jgi:ribA/ribD-fused uncharacterized protein
MNARPEPVRLSMSDAESPLATFSRHAVELDGACWPSVEHYVQAMRFADPALREQVRKAPHPADARRIARANRRRVRADWRRIEETVMTRGWWVKCRTHPEVAEALLATGDRPLVETSQYDYHWGCGRDGRGHNAYGRILMAVRERLRAEPGTTAGSTD